MRTNNQAYSTARNTYLGAAYGLGCRTQLFAYAYYRLSREEAQKSESTSISNQKKIVEAYCKQNGITILKFFVDDGWSGGNFERPGFQEMMRALETGKANVVITKDLSRLGHHIFGFSVEVVCNRNIANLILRKELLRIIAGFSHVTAQARK